MKVTKEFLVKGAIYALEQCGLLLSDAVALVDQKSYSSAVVLAAFAREELGRSRIIINYFDELVKNNSTPTLDDIKKACEDHVTKQESAQLSTTLSFPNNSRVGVLMLARFRLTQSGQAQSEEYKNLDMELADITKRKRKRTPHDRHEARALALYVQPVQDGSGWNVPKNTPPDFARNFIMEASNDYSNQRQIIDSSLRTNPEFSKELLKWKERPEVPLPKWPTWQTPRKVK